MLFELLARVSKTEVPGYYNVLFLPQCADGAFKTPFDQSAIKAETLEKAALFTHSHHLSKVTKELPVKLYDYASNRAVKIVSSESTVLAGANAVNAEQLSKLLVGVLSAIVETHNGILVIECHTGVRKHEFYGKGGCAELIHFCETTF